MKSTDNTLLFSRAMDKYRESEFAVSVTVFLSPGEKQDVYNQLLTRIGNGVAGCFFWGGCRGAERCSAVFLPEWYRPEGAPHHRMVPDTERTDFFAAYLSENPHILEEIPITALSIKGSGFRTLTHRDFMGGILSLGIDRSVIGDIAVLSESEAVVFADNKIVPYLCESLTKIGRDGVKVSASPLPPTFQIPRQYEESVLTVSSPRLDGIVKAITGKSRETAAEMVRNGLVELSYRETTDVSADVNEEDILSIRGYGKYVIGNLLGETKSGRVKILCKKYI